MQPVYIDFDDVITETGQACLEVLQKEFGRTADFEDLTTFDLKVSLGLSDDEFEHFFKILHQPEVVLKYQPIEGAIEGLNHWASQGINIAIVTGRFTSSYDASLQWLANHNVRYDSFTMVNKYQREDSDPSIAITLEELKKRKYSLAVEDSEVMAAFLSDEMRVPVALFDRPWNQNAKLNGKVTRYHTWDQLKEIKPDRLES